MGLEEERERAGGEEFSAAEGRKAERESRFSLPKIMAGTKKQKEIGEIFNKGKGARGKLLKVRYLLKCGTEPRCIFVVSRRFGKAARRNKIRRKIKEAWRKLAPRVLRGACLAFIPKEGAGEEKTVEFEKDMERIFEREKILDEN